MSRLLVFNLATDADDPVLAFTTGWLNRLAAHYDALDVITMRAGRIEVAANVQVWSVGKERGYSEARRVGEFYRLLRARLAEGRYDACFAHMMPLFAVLGAPLLAAARVPVTLWYTHRSPHWTVRAAVPLVRRVVTAAPDSFPLPTAKLRVIGHGIDTEFFSPRHASEALTPRPVPEALTPRPPLPQGEGEQDEPHPPAPSPRREWEHGSASLSTFNFQLSTSFPVVHVARLMPIKHQDTLIRAVADVPGTGAVLIGEVPPAQDAAYRDSLIALAAELGVAERVTLAGALPAEGVRDAYRGAFAAVNLSPPGLFDKAALEAMACGVPTIVSNAAFDALLGDDAPLLRTLGPEDVDGLTGRLLALLDLPAEARAALGARLRTRTVEAHSLDALIPRLVRVLNTGEPA